MNKILKGLRVVESSAFVACPLGGMTLAQLGADVIRFDPLRGGIDARRWPITKEGKSLYWAGLNKARRARDPDQPHHGPGRGQGCLLDKPTRRQGLDEL